MSPAPAETPRRLFLALWPTPNIRQQVAELATTVAGPRRVPDANLHLTLVFLGATDSNSLLAYETALATLTVPPLELTLDRYGYWPAPRILWLGCRQSPPELSELVNDLHCRLRHCGFIPERRAFQAHITLARRFTGTLPKKPPKTPIHWNLEDVSLVESLQAEAGTRYEVRQRWPRARLDTASVE